MTEGWREGERRAELNVFFLPFPPSLRQPCSLQADLLKLQQSLSFDY